MRENTTQTQNKRLVTAMVESATVNCFQSFTYSQQLALFTRLTGRLYNSTKLENWLLLRIGSSNSWTLCPSAPNWGQPTRQPAIPTYLTAFSFSFLSLSVSISLTLMNPIQSVPLTSTRGDEDRRIEDEDEEDVEEEKERKPPQQFNTQHTQPTKIPTHKQDLPDLRRRI